MKQIVISDNCHLRLKSMMQHKRETYGDVVERLIQEHEKVVLFELSKGEIKLSPLLTIQIKPPFRIVKRGDKTFS